MYLPSSEENHAKKIIAVEYSNHVIINELHEKSLSEDVVSSQRR